MTLQAFESFKRHVRTILISYGECRVNDLVSRMCDLIVTQEHSVTPYQMAVLKDICKEIAEFNLQAADRMIARYKEVL